MIPQLALDVSPLSTLIGNSPTMKQVHRLVTRMGATRFPVLILGETGTGKEVAARAIHNFDSKGQFVVVDCSSLVAPLMESEIFGYSKGAFTGANTQKLGLLDAANGGTAFFDEIGELPLEQQAKLLRVLQEKQYRPVGGVAQRGSDFRIIAATNRDLLAEVEANRFRRDLYYRLAVMRLRLSPLRERKEDIPTLVMHFLQRFGKDHKVNDETMQILCEYSWPGNVRELQHTVQQMVAMNSGPWLTRVDLPSAIGNSLLERVATASSAGLQPSESGAMATSIMGQSVMPLAEVEKRAILQAVEHTRGDRTVAAALLGIGRTTLYRKLKEYGFQ